MNFMSDAISLLAPNSSWSLIEDDYDNIIWYSTDITKPSKSAVLAKVAELELQYSNEEYQRLREKEYPSLVDQLDMQYWDKINGTNTWEQAIQTVKDKYPKP